MSSDLPQHIETQSPTEQLSYDVNEMYLCEIRQHHLLTAEEQILLAQRVEAGQSAQAKLEAGGESLDPGCGLEFEQAIQDGQTARRRMIVPVGSESRLDVEARLATGDDQQNTCSTDGAKHLGDHVWRQVTRWEAFASP